MKGWCVIIILANETLEKYKMKAKQNLHIHTTYADGKDTPEELVSEAILRGFDSIGFSEHTYLKYSNYPNQMTVEKMALYKSEIAALKQKYKGRIDIFCGLEYDFYSEVETAGFDYLIGSVHYLDCNGKIVTFDNGLLATVDYLKAHFGGNNLAFAKKYYETIARLPERGQFDIIGHFDLVTKNNEIGNFLDTTSLRYRSLGLEAIDALTGKIPFFEINTGAIARGYRSAPYPQMDFLKEFRQRGFGAIITSDCHNKSFIDCAYDEARELLLTAGFRSQWILTDKGFKEIQL